MFMYMYTHSTFFSLQLDEYIAFQTFRQALMFQDILYLCVCLGIQLIVWFCKFFLFDSF